jgi:amidase
VECSRFLAAAGVADDFICSFGLSFLGARFTEAKLIGLAYAFEQRTMVRNKVQPYIMPNVELKDIVGS